MTAGAVLMGCGAALLLSLEMAWATVAIALIWVLLAMMLSTGTPAARATRLPDELRASLGRLGFVRPRFTSPTPRLAVVLWCLVVPAVVAAVYYGAQTVLADPLTRWLPPLNPAQVLASEHRFETSTNAGLLSAAVLAPLFGAALPEELVFRSIPLAVQRRWPRRAGLIAAVTAVLVPVFALTHIQFGWVNVVSAGLGGAVYSALALYTRSLW
ncbi:hypothetical protein Ntsu_81140 [Nocardia sp. IFM 10818]